MKTREERDHLIRELGARNFRTLEGCAQSTFTTIVDYLRDEEGIEIMPPDVQDQAFKMMVGLSGGVGNCGDGNCGALSGVSFILSYVTGIDHEPPEYLLGNRCDACDKVACGIGKKYLAEYGGLSCRAVTWAKFGVWYDSWNPEAKSDFARDERERGCEGPATCTIPNAAAWGVEMILEAITDAEGR
jgi:hypothetical protein